MNTIKLQLLLLLNIFYVSDCVRRIQGGDQVYTDKSYMVYLVKSPKSDKPYDEWLCGGALVTTWFIITAQACVNDVEYMYAIAGYDTYVPDSDIEINICTREKKKKVVYFCVPEGSEIKYDNKTEWLHIDIALAKVESAYDLNDVSFKKLCSYTPTVIPINFEPRFEESGTDGIVLGWGHTTNWRQPLDSRNYNKKMLRYAPIKIMEKNKCKLDYARYPLMGEVIDRYMICTMEDGQLNEEGKIMISPSSSPKALRCNGPGVRSEDNCNEYAVRRGVLRSNETSYDSVVEIRNRTLVNQTSRSRRSSSSGICQNDHGGPFVTWVGSKEVLIGVSSTFKVSNDAKCIGPYLFTSTQRNAAFIDCVLTNNSGWQPMKHRDNRRSILCGSLPIRSGILPVQSGINIIETYISWSDHPAGAADNDALANVKYVGDTLNSKTNATASISKAFEELIRLETFWERQNVKSSN